MWDKVSLKVVDEWRTATGGGYSSPMTVQGGWRVVTRVTSINFSELRVQGIGLMVRADSRMVSPSAWGLRFRSCSGFLNDSPF
ncbi:hypothetical protein Bca101_025711 [Brassica carinata]